ncbi:unnamed protein product [Dovyalis caffra]|uniref:Uncharacterized protein n=1 Tax=Dovyalis caffra TaxID=77055 RepID=A0AAV1RLP0_9ROSI|nr:unnamed protein product [Dovyalis caffra]
MPKPSALTYSGSNYPQVLIRGPFSCCAVEEMAFWATPSLSQWILIPRFPIGGDGGNGTITCLKFDTASADGLLKFEVTSPMPELQSFPGVGLLSKTTRGFNISPLFKNQRSAALLSSRPFQKKAALIPFLSVYLQLSFIETKVLAEKGEDWPKISHGVSLEEWDKLLQFGLLMKFIAEFESAQALLLPETLTCYYEEQVTA